MMIVLTAILFAVCAPNANFGYNRLQNEKLSLVQIKKSRIIIIIIIWISVEAKLPARFNCPGDDGDGGDVAAESG